MTDQLKISDLDLTAYIDGELDADRVRAVEDAVSRDAGLAARIAAYRADKSMLKRIYAPLAEHSIPSAWTELARASPYPAARARHSWRLVGAIAAVVLVILGGWRFYDVAHRPVAAGDVIKPPWTPAVTGHPRKRRLPWPILARRAAMMRRWKALWVSMSRCRRLAAWAFRSQA